MENNHTYSEGEWIVHSQYGIGQIKGIDVKDISGEDTDYFRIQAADSTFWIPTDKMNSELIRPLSTSAEIQQAIATLQEPPKEMSSNHKTRQNRIKRAWSRNTPIAIARIIRDLKARRRSKGPLNKTERSAYRTLKQRLVDEWAIVEGKKREKVASRIDRLLSPEAVAEEEKEQAEAPQKAAVAESSKMSRKRKKWNAWLPRR